MSNGRAVFLMVCVSVCVCVVSIALTVFTTMYHVSMTKLVFVLFGKYPTSSKEQLMPMRDKM